MKLGWAFIATAFALAFVIHPERMLYRFMAGHDHSFLVVASGIAFFAGWCVQQFVFDGIPHVTDAISHLFQARIFAMGRLHAPAPQCPEAFYQFHILMTHSGMWFTKYTPGHALLLSVGIFIGALDLVLPLSAAVSTYLLGRLIFRYESPLFSRTFIALYVLSPLGILLSASYMSHYTAFCMAVAGVFFLERTLREPTGKKGNAVFTGFFFLFSAIIRPHEFLMIGLAGFIFFCTLPRAIWGIFFNSLHWMILGATPIIAFWAYWNLHIYGDILAIGYGFSGDDIMHAPFQGTFGLNDSFGLKEALSVLIWNLDRINRSLLGWPMSLLFLPFALFKKPTRTDLIAWLSVSIVIGVYFFYNYRAEYESRYYFLALAPLIFLTTRGIQMLIRATAHKQILCYTRNLLMGTVMAFYVHAVINYWPDQLLPTYGQHYYFASPRIHQKVEGSGITNAVVMIYPPDGNRFVYSSGFLFNDPLLSSNLIYARYNENFIDCITEHYPTRSLYLYKGGPDGSGSVLKIEK
jgi:hypothetical protein